jgi:3-keto-disaccharide hydrolase
MKQPALVAVGILVLSLHALSQSPAQWKAHDMNRPRPPIIKPSDQKLPIQPPSDAVILFDGRDLSQWRSDDGSPAKWVAANGYMESVKGSGYIFSRRTVGDFQLHVEWAAPVPAMGKSQGRGNSGVFLMGQYEIQVLDSYENDTYPDGQAASVYGQYPPLVNVCRPPGEWQSYDIVFRRPRFDRNGGLLKAARVTLLHNGVLVQDNVELWGPTNWLQHSPYFAHPDRLPISLQDHGNPVRFRNIWLRELPEWNDPAPTNAKSDPVVVLQSKELERFVGKYQRQTSNQEIFSIKHDGTKLQANFAGPSDIELVPNSEREFSLRWTAGKLVFDLASDGKPTGFTFHLGGEQYPVKRIE